MRKTSTCIGASWPICTTLFDRFIVPYSLCKFGIYSKAKLIRQSQTPLP